MHDLCMSARWKDADGVLLEDRAVDDRKYNDGVEKKSAGTDKTQR
jgi:hypothetical protein